MLTRSGKALKPLQQDAQGALNPPVKEPLTLLSLPDVPLLVVLSYLQPKTLIAAGQAHPRLGALTRAHSSVWKGKTATDFYYRETVNELRDLLRVVPPVLKLKYEVKRCPVLVAHFEEFDRQTVSPAITTLVVQGPDMWALTNIIHTVKFTLESLEVKGVERGLELLFVILRNTLLLRSLEVRFTRYFAKCAMRWPTPGTTLSRLRSVSFTSTGSYYDGTTYRGPDPSMLDALRSFLRAHSNILSCVKLGSEQMQPLVDACGPALPTLSLTADGRGSDLSHLLGLKDLSVHCGAAFQLDKFLPSCRAPLDRLDLRNVPKRMARRLGTITFTTLRHLSISGDCSSWSSSTLAAAIKGMPNLHSLTVLDVRRPRMFQLLDRLPVDAIPKLSVVVFTDAYGLALSSDESDDSTSDSDFDDSDGSLSNYAGSSACRKLVQRAPMPLHVAVSIENTGKGIMYFKHNVMEAKTCALCMEATATMSSRCGETAKINHLAQI